MNTALVAEVQDVQLRLREGGREGGREREREIN
jgi:hypothetical protein